jgi:hypothetical protein
MSLDGQLEQLRALYAEKSDGELLDLHDQCEGLTELAQQALAEVMRERGLGARNVPSGPTSQAGPSQVGPGATTEDVLVENEMLAYLFHDAFEAREAIRNMTEAGIAHRMLDWHSVDPELPVSYSGVDLGLVVQVEDAQRTLVVLKEKLGLFPAPENEIDDASGSASGNSFWNSFGGGADAVDALTVLSMFERGEGLVAAQALGEAGITYLWRDGREEASGLPDEETVSIEVRQADLARATKLVEDAFAALPEDAR